MATYGRNDGANGDPGPGQDPAFILQCLQDLKAGRMEFPIKVEGAHTLPYASEVMDVDGGLVLKLIRPLPHELAAGALFEMVFSAGEQRFQGLISFQKREAYLTYRFTVPTQLTLCDRRRHKRHPFRPRERVDVLAQDGAVPGHGLTGPLSNLSLGGLCLRVDRIVRLDSGLRIPPSTAFFERGRALPLLRILNLPKVPLLEARGSIAHAQEIDGQVLVGIEFGDLSPENGALLQQVLDIRERALRTSGASAGPSPQAEQRPARPPAAPKEAPEPAAPAPLRMLRRRTRDLWLVAGPEAGRARLADLLQSAGYVRTCVLPTPEELPECGADGGGPVPLLVVLLDPQPGTLATVRTAQQALGDWSRVPTLFLSSEPDPLTDLAEQGSWRLLQESASRAWLEVLDGWGAPD